MADPKKPKPIFPNGRFPGVDLPALQQRNKKAATDQAAWIYDTFTPGLNKTEAGRQAAIDSVGRNYGAPTSTTTTGQAGAWSTNYGTTAETEKAKLLAAQEIPKPPAGIPTTRPAAPKPFTADMLYQDATSAYQPLLDLYGQQQQAARERYGVNQADIKNIFGNLTTIRGEDKAKIAQQFKTSIEQQQQALAARTAEARQGVAAGQQGAATAAAEMGTAGQPAPTDSLTAQAAEQGIADANAYQTTWSALQNVMSQQAQNDVDSAVRGYDYQKASALEQLRANLEDRLAGIESNMANTQSQIAQTNYGSKQNVLNTKYAEEQARQEAIARAQAAAQAAASKKPSYASNLFGLQQRAADAQVDYSQIQSTVNDAYASAFAALNPGGVYDEKENPTGTKSPKTPKKADILNAWNYIKSGSPQTAARLSPFVTEYVDQQY
jgi:hypothetical protein